MQIQEKPFAELTAGRLPVEQLMKEHGIPGCTVAVIRGRELVFTQAYGVRDDKGTPMTETTLFECASLTKSVFALLAMQEADAGRLDLDEPIAPRLKDGLWSEDPRYLTITPRQALSHGTGLPNWSAKPMELLFAPGTGYSYSGEGYFLLQKLVEQQQGKNMHELFCQRFFEKYGMKQSAAIWTPAVGAAFSYGFDSEGKVTKIRDSRRTGGNAPEPNSAWSLYSWSGDYARFLCGLLQERGGLSQKMFDEMTSRQNTATPFIDWGLGFGIVREQPDVLWHWGDNDGFKSLAIWDKRTGDGAVINTNSDNGMEFYMELLPQLTDGTFFPQIEDFIRHAE